MEIRTQYLLLTVIGVIACFFVSLQFGMLAKKTDHKLLYTEFINGKAVSAYYYDRKSINKKSSYEYIVNVVEANNIIGIKFKGYKRKEIKYKFDASNNTVTPIMIKIEYISFGQAQTKCEQINFLPFKIDGSKKYHLYALSSIIYSRYVADQ